MKNENRKILYSKGFKIFCCIMWMLSMFVFFNCLIRLCVSMASGEPWPERAENYEETRYCGKQVSKKLKNMKYVFEDEKRFNQQYDRPLIDIMNPYGDSDTWNEYTTYYVDSIEKMTMDGSMERLKKGLEEAHNLLKNNGSITEEQEDKIYQKVDPEIWYKIDFSEEFKYLFAEEELWETQLPLSGISLAEYIFELNTYEIYDIDIDAMPYDLPLRDLYLVLIDMGDKITQHKEDKARTCSLPILFFI